MSSPAAMQDFARAHVAGRDLHSDAFPHDLWRTMGAAGLFRIGLREEFGGSGGGYRAIAEAERALVEEGGSLGFGLSWTGHQLTALWFIDKFANDAQRRGHLPRLASGEFTASVAISEPGIGAHPKHLKATAKRDGDSFVVDGEKAFVTNGPIADLFVVLAILDGRGPQPLLRLPGAEKHAGLRHRAHQAAGLPQAFAALPVEAGELPRARNVDAGR
jgi:alkylation response protein AidB-like acyl-CoA dehydrogenase